MPCWHENMTHEDFDRNAREIAAQRKADAFNLRQRAKALLAEADRIDPPQPSPDTSNTRGPHDVFPPQ